MQQQTVVQAGGICLRGLLPGSRFLGDDDIRVVSCCSDSRACRPGDLFVALVGERHDGHDYASQAIRRGAAAVLAERPLPLSVPTCVVEDTHIAFGQVCQALAGHPSQRLRIVGVTGTYGKTTATMLTAAVFEAAGHRVGIMGSLGFCDALETAPAGRPLPAAPEMADWLARMTVNGCSHAVIEASSQALSLHRMAGIELDAAILTNLRRANLDYHGSVLNYHRAKNRLFHHLGPHGVAVLNADDAASTVLMSRLQCPVMTVSMAGEGELTATVVERHKSEQTFLLTAGADTIAVRTPLVGDHHVYQCLSAAAAGLLGGIDLPTIVRGIESVKTMPGRMERIECGQPFGTFVDAARTPEALSTTLRALRRVTTSRLICVFGAPGGRDEQLRPLLGSAAERNSDLMVITSDNPASEPPLQIAHDILDGCRRPGSPHILPERARAIQWALHEAEEGDTVLIAGKGCDKGQRIGDQVYPFDDREVARYCLHQLGETTPMIA